jgi:D-alanine-D-alanine ligase
VEVTGPVLETVDGPRVFPAVEIRPDGGVYDYTARYTAGSTEFVVPAQIAGPAATECARVAQQAHTVLGLRDLSRSDLMVDESGAVWFLEVNVAPGMTETSLVPLSFETAGLGLGEAFAQLVGQAVGRRKDHGSRTGRAEHRE